MATLIYSMRVTVNSSGCPTENGDYVFWMKVIWNDCVTSSAFLLLFSSFFWCYSLEDDINKGYVKEMFTDYIYLYYM